MIRLIVLVCALFQAGFSQQKKSDVDLVKADVQHCMNETKVSSEALKKAYREDNFGSSEPLKCYQKCLMTKENKINKDGHANLESIMNFHKKSLDVITKCKELKADNTCEHAYQLHQCMNGLKKIV